jgi:Protein kinase domain
MTLDERLVELLMRAEDLRAEGVAVSPEELCRDCPELLSDVERLLQGIGDVEQLLHAPECAAAGTPSEAVSPARTVPPLSRVPDFEILGELGRGGMGVVYKARHVALGRIVALKVIRAGAHASPEELARFQREAEAAARLSHPNIVQVYQVGASEGLPYCALEYVEGETLAHHLERGPLPPREVASLIESLAAAAHLAHSRNIVHRDLKPANILLAASGVATPGAPQTAIPKITDFGLARRLDDEVGQTQTGAIVGTPAYMAPEQTSGQRHAVGPAADVYALGAILYECLTGRPPFEGKNALETLDQVRHREPPPPSQVHPKVPRDLETICLKCLRKEPEKRYGSAQELADDLGRFLRGEAVAARPVGLAERLAKWARRRPAVAALLIVLLVMGPTVVGLAIAAKLREQDASLARIQSERVAQAEEEQRRIEEDRQRSRDAETRLLMTRTDALGHNPRGPDDVEREALWKLTQDQDDVQRHFFERLLNQEHGPERLGRRAEAALRAGIRFDTGRRNALAALLRDRLADDPRATAPVRTACTTIATTLRAPDAELTLRACRVLLEEMQSLSVKLPVPAQSTAATEEALSEANQERDQTMARDAHAVAVLVSALGADQVAELRTEAALRLVERMRISDSEVLGPRLLELVEQLPPDSVRRVSQAFLDKPINLWQGEGADQTVERLLAVLTRHLTPEEADRRLRLFLEKREATRPGDSETPAQARAALIKRLTPDQAARLARLVLDESVPPPDKPDENPRFHEKWSLLPDLIDRLRPEQIDPIAKAVFPRAPAKPDEIGPGFDRPVASRLAERLPPEQAACWGAYFIDRAMAPGEMHLSPLAVELFEQLTARLSAAWGAELCRHLVDAILDELPRSQDPNRLLDVLAHLGPRLAPEQAPWVACVVVDLLERAGQTVDSLPPPALGEPGPAWDSRYRVYAAANVLSALVKALPGEESADLCALALRNLLRDKRPGEPREESWDTVPDRLTACLTLQHAEALAIEVVKKLAEAAPFEIRGHLVRMLARLAGRLSPEAAARLFPLVLRRLDALSRPSGDTPLGMTPQEVNQVAADQVGEALAALAGRLAPETAAAQGRQIVAEVRQLNDKPGPSRPADDLALVLRVRLLTSLGGSLPPDSVSFLAGILLDRMDETADERTWDALSNNLVRLGKSLTPQQRDETARRLIAVLAHSGGSGPLNEHDRVKIHGTLTGESGRAAIYIHTLAGLASHLSPEQAGEAARIVVDRIARTLPPPRSPRAEPGTPGAQAHPFDQQDFQARRRWRGRIDNYHEGLAALVPIASDQALVDLLKSPDCVDRRSDLVYGALKKRFGENAADPWTLADWLRQHRPDLDLDTPPRRLRLEDQR